jgi:Flp pilus assembly protein TadD
VLDEARKRPSPDGRIAYYAGLVHERLKNYRSAEQAFSEVPEDAELFDDARIHRAGCLSLGGHHDKALTLLKKAISDRPQRPDLLAAYARVLERSGAPHKAEQFLLSQLNDASRPEIVEALAASYQRQGRGKDAVTLLARALDVRPQDESLLYALGTAYERQGDVDNAIHCMRKLLEANPRHAPAMNFIGYVLAERGRELEEAEDLVLQALALRPDEASFLDSLGWLYYRRGDYERAVSVLERATALAPDEPVINDHLGDAYMAVSKKMKAVDAFQRALEALRQLSDPPDDPAQKANIERKLKKLSTEAAGR